MRVLSVNNLTYYVNQGLFQAMIKAGYEVHILPLNHYAKAEQYQVLNNCLNQFQPDYIFTPGWSIGMFDIPTFFQAIKEHHLPHIYWATEDPIFFNEVSIQFAPQSDYVFTTADECNTNYRELGVPSSTLMFGCNPHMFHRKVPKPEFQHDIVLIANNYHWFPEDKSFRRKAIEDIVVPLVKKGYDLKIWGMDWTNPEYGFWVDPKFYGGYADYAITPYIYSSAKIVLGIQSVNTSLTQTSVRTFEIMGTGAFYLSCYTPSHEHLFQNHHHMVWSRSAQETVELVDYYLNHPVERNAIAKNGQTEVLKKHTYTHRLHQLEQKLRPYLSRKRRWMKWK